MSRTRFISSIIAVGATIMVLYCGDQSNPNARYTTAPSGLVLRSQPSTSSTKMGLLPLGTEVEFVEEVGETQTIAGASGRWTRVRHEGRDGYVFGGFLSDTSPIAETVAGDFQCSCPGSPIEEKSFCGIRPGMSEAELRTLAGERVVSQVLRTGEGDFPYLSLRDENGQEIAELHLDDTAVQWIRVNGEGCKTANGVGPGSTVAELRAIFPYLDIHGSEIEGQTSASSRESPFAFHLTGVNFWSYELTEEELDSIDENTARVEYVSF